MVVALIGPGRDKVITLRRHFIDCEFAAHAALIGQQVRQGYATDLFRDGIGQKLVKPGLRTGARNFAFGKGAHVLNAKLFMHMAAFIANMFEIVGPPE